MYTTLNIGNVRKWAHAHPILSVALSLVAVAVLAFVVFSPLSAQATVTDTGVPCCGGGGGFDWGFWGWGGGYDTHIDGGGGGGCVGRGCLNDVEPYCTITANPNPSPTPGGPVTLTWTSYAATSASINNGVGPVTPVNAGSVVVYPTVNTTYTMTTDHATWGGVTCQVTVTVPPPTNGCIQVLKETYDTNGNILNPVAQFTFKLDGNAQTALNDANGNAIFNNVSVGTHTVTEIVPPTWQMLSVTPANGIVVVTPGPVCAAVVFKNKQVITTPPPACTLTLTPSVIDLGESVTLGYTSDNATQISIDEDTDAPLGAIAGGTVTAHPTQTTTYHFHAINGDQVATCTQTVIVRPTTGNSCPVPSALSDTTKQTVNPAPNPEKDLQEILDDDTSYNLNVSADQKQFQNWTVTSGSHIQIAAKYANHYSDLKQVFGYYLNGDISTFTPIFKTNAIPGQESVPLASAGPFTVAPHVGGTVGFAIKSYHTNGTLYGVKATENALNQNGRDQVVAYNPLANTYVLGFEDVIQGDDDYNDLVVELTLGCEVPSVPVTIKATKIVCTNEADLPNWGTGGPNITATTATDWVAAHASCHLESGWTFEWANDGVSNPGDEDGVGGAGWNAFGPTNGQGVATAIVNAFTGTKIWVREQFKNGYIPFTGTGINNVSAEMYCHTDVLNYDNYDFIANPVQGQTYNCVAWNVPTPPPEEHKGCIQVLKETYNTQGVQITPVAQFSFKLDGNQTVQNDANGNAIFTNVTPGTHTVTEVNPGNTWTLLSTTPVNGVVVVTEGPVCAAVVFKNKQIITNNPPTCTLNSNPNTLTAPGNSTLSWTTTNATSFTINQGVGSVTPVAGGTVGVNATTTTTYIGTASGPGGVVNCPTTVTITPTVPVPACTLSINKTNIKSGESVIVSWTSQNMTAGFINNNVGSTTPVAAGSSVEIFPPNSTTYTGTFTGPYGNATCTVDVTVGTTGCQGSCGGGGYNTPNVVMYKQPGESGLVASVFLSQIPYTGFEAGPALTALFWLAVALLAALIAFFALGRRGFNLFSNHLAAYVGVPTAAEMRNAMGERDQAQYESFDESYTAEVVHEVPQNIVLQSVAAPVPIAFAPAKTVATEVGASVGIPALTDVIESRAHAAGVLMSPESVKLASQLSTDRAENLRIFGEVLNDAVKTIPREDGWIMLTSDKLEELAEKASAKIAPVQAPAPVVAPVAAVVDSGVRTYTYGERADEASATAFVAAIVSGDRDTAFGIVRSLEHASVSPATLMTSTATVLDRLYRVRQGGKNGVDKELLAASMNVNDENLHKLVEVFTHALDIVYSNPFTGVKLALAQAFEVVG